MGNKVPREYSGATCSKCSKSLPPCSSWKEIETRSIKGTKYKVFNHGEYYCRVGVLDYECRRCFYGASRGDKSELTRSELPFRRFQEERDKCTAIASMSPAELIMVIESQTAIE